MDIQQTEQKICAAICRSDGLKAREIASALGIDHKTVNRVLYNSPLLHELCWQGRDYRWHGNVRQARPHVGLHEFAGYYGSVSEFTELTEEAWLQKLTEGCTNIGRNLNDTRGLFHSFRDCREQMLRLFSDLRDMVGQSCLTWEVAFELRLKRSRYVRLYADVLVVTENRVFALEFKMKDKLDPDYEVIPVLVLTGRKEYFDFAPVGDRDAVLPVCSGDMLFNAFDEYLKFLRND